MIQPCNGYAAKKKKIEMGLVYMVPSHQVFKKQGVQYIIMIAYV